jgi:hypothetical protein
MKLTPNAPGNPVASTRWRMEQRLQESFDNPRHFEKVVWFAKYWNDAAATFGTKNIAGPGIDINITVWGP